MTSPGYYAWRAWRLAGGLPFRRPLGLPVKVPALWWTRIALYRLRHPVSSAPNLGTIGWGLSALFNIPNGGTDDVAMYYFVGGLRTWFLNDRVLGWDVIRQRIAQVHGSLVPWQRCYVKDDVTHLIAVAGAWGAAAIGVNYEPSGPDTTLTPEEILSEIKDYKGAVYVIVSPWMENDAHWRILGARCVFIIEGFTNEKPWPIHDLIEHAHKCGARQVVVMAGVYDAAYPPPASWPEWQSQGGAPIVYLGDNFGADISKWKAWNPIAPREV